MIDLFDKIYGRYIASQRQLSQATVRTVTEPPGPEQAGVRERYELVAHASKSIPPTTAEVLLDNLLNTTYHSSVLIIETGAHGAAAIDAEYQTIASDVVEGSSFTRSTRLDPTVLHGILSNKRTHPLIPNTLFPLSLLITNYDVAIAVTVEAWLYMYDIMH